MNIATNPSAQAGTKVPGPRVNWVKQSPELAKKFYTAALDRTLELAAEQTTLEEPRLREIARGALYMQADLAQGAVAITALREELLERLDG